MRRFLVIGAAAFVSTAGVAGAAPAAPPAAAPGAGAPQAAAKATTTTTSHDVTPGVPGSVDPNATGDAGYVPKLGTTTTTAAHGRRSAAAAGPGQHRGRRRYALTGANI